MGAHAIKRISLRLAAAGARIRALFEIEEEPMKIGVLRGRENSFPDAFIAKVNSMGKGVSAEFAQLGGTKLNEPVPYRVILDRMSHEVPYYAVYLKMAALQGTYCINNTFWRSADDKFFGYAAAEKLGIAEPKTVVLPNRECVDDVTSQSLRNLWPTDFGMYLDYVGVPCIMKPAFGGGWKDVHKIHSQEELLVHYDASGQKTMMLQEFIDWDTYIRVPTIGRRWARAIRYDPAPGGRGGYHQDYDILPRATPGQGRGVVVALQPRARLRHERPGVRGQGRAVLRDRPHQLHPGHGLPELQRRPFPVGRREDGGVRGGKGPFGRTHSQGPDFRALMLR